MNVKISELKDRVGTVIPGVKGIIVSVFPPKEGKGEHGAWKLQNISIEEDGVKTQVTLSGLQTLSENDKGKEIQFESKGTKFGLKGVSVEQREHNGKTYMGVKVTKTAQIRWVGASESVQEDATEAQFPVKDSSDVLSKAFQDHLKDKPGKTPADRIKQFELLYDICFASAQNTNAVVSVTSQELIKDIATTFFIQAVREGLADKMEVEEHDAF